MPNLFVPMIFAWLNFWRTCFSVSPSMYINPFMFPICPGVILSELSSSLRSNSLGVFDKQFRDCFRCVFSIAIRISRLSLKTWGIALKFLFLHHENILFPND